MYVLLVIAFIATALVLRDVGRRRKLWTWIQFAVEAAAIASGMREPSAGYLQRAALYAILGLQTVSVTGRIQLPHHIELLLDPEAAAIADSFGSSFLGDILVVIQERADLEGWQTDVVSILIVIDASVRSFRPIARMGRAREPWSVDPDQLATDPIPEAQPSTLVGNGSETVRCDGLELIVESHPELPSVRAGSADELLIVGRCDVDAVIAVPTVSARHCRLRRDGSGAWTVEDLGSTNGTFLNGKPVRAAASLNPGDVLGLGREVTLRCVR